jgi:hypothetical protein
MDPKDGKWDR